MWTEWGNFSSSTAWATALMICRGVTPKWSTTESMSSTLPAGRFFQTSTPPGLTSLAAYPFARAQEPADERLYLLRLLLLDGPHQVMVIAHQDIKAFVDARRVLELFMRVPRREGRNGGVEGRGITQAGVLVARGERTGHAPHRAAVGDPGAADGLGTPLLLGAHLPRGVDLGPDNVAVHVDAAGHDHQPRASMVRVGLISGSVGGSTILLPAIQMSRTSPSIPLAGS